MRIKQLLRKAREKWPRIVYERLTEPLHLNVLSALVAVAGSYRAKIAFDLVVRQQYAFCLLKTADYARQLGLQTVTVIEFGVASGAGLMNMCEIARNVTAVSSVRFKIFGFDSGKGLPAPRDYRDHPEAFGVGSFPMLDRNALIDALPWNAQLVIGEVRDTLPAFMSALSPASPLGFVAVDVDSYSSAKQCLEVLRGPSACYLPMTLVYLDDIGFDSANQWVGELLAVEEFNDENRMRKIHPFAALRKQRIFKHAGWIDQVYLASMFDHVWYDAYNTATEKQVLVNPYL